MIGIAIAVVMVAVALTAAVLLVRRLFRSNRWQDAVDEAVSRGME